MKETNQVNSRLTRVRQPPEAYLDNRELEVYQVSATFRQSLKSDSLGAERVVEQSRTQNYLNSNINSEFDIERTLEKET
jgi:hypothetical protein